MLLLWAAVATARAPLGAQGGTSTAVASDVEFQKEANGTPLGRLAKGTPISLGGSQGGWVEVRFEGWLAGNAVRTDRRDGYDLAVSLAAGTTLRSAPGGGTALATLRAGVLLKRLESKGEWVRVQRSAWIPRSATTAATPAATAAATPSAQPAKPAADSGSGATTVSAGATFASAPSGSPLATLEVPVAVQVLERRDGWARVQVEGWVREGNLGEGGLAGGITAADIRANPDRYIGQTVEWTLQVLAVQTADELRPELPPGQPYILARGPLPETGFVYLSVSSQEAATFRAMEPLAKVRIRATIRAGRSRFLPTPVLTFVRRLD